MKCKRCKKKPAEMKIGPAPLCGDCFRAVLGGDQTVLGGRDLRNDPEIAAEIKAEKEWEQKWLQSMR